MLFSRLRSFVTTWTRRQRFEDFLDEEIRFHLDAYTQDLIRSGVPSRDAERRARIHFGSIEGVKDDCRQARGLRIADELEQMITNLRPALRMFVKKPVVTNSDSGGSSTRETAGSVPDSSTTCFRRPVDSRSERGVQQGKRGR